MTRTNPFQATRDLIVQEGDILQTWHQTHHARHIIVAIALVCIEYIKYFWHYLHYLYKRFCKKLETQLRKTDVIRQWDLTPRQLDQITVYTLLCCGTDGDTWSYTNEQALHLRKCITKRRLVGPGNRRMDDWPKLQAKDFRLIMKRLVEADASDHLDYYCRWKAPCAAWRFVRTEYKAAEASGRTFTERELRVKLMQKYGELVQQTPYKASLELSACARWQLVLGIHHVIEAMANPPK